MDFLRCPTPFTPESTPQPMAATKAPEPVQTQPEFLEAIRLKARRFSAIIIRMNTFSTIAPEELSANTFKMIGKDWLLITAEKDGAVNTMTASWGGIGIMWNKPVAYIFIRPQRYTKEFVDANEQLSLSVLGDSFRKQLSYLGSVSGRDEPKIEKAGLTVRHEDGVPFFDQANTVLVCRKLFAQELNPAGFVDASIDGQMYPGHDYHTMYICEIEKVLVRGNF